jgi:hypothetical protein
MTYNLTSLSAHPTTILTAPYLRPVTRARACIIEDTHLITRNSSCLPVLILILSLHNLLMAPDLNSLDSLLKTPQTDRSQSQPLQTRTPSYSALSTTNSRRTSQTMAPPSASADRMHMPHRVSSGHEQDGPLRHPRPLTAAELYSECEKEQEAVVCLLEAA